MIENFQPTQKKWDENYFKITWVMCGKLMIWSYVMVKAAKDQR